ncbi:hypothetical protein BOTNAR_1123g00020 [Botryotinia narcissicola]|uniref:Uncharacterized protein n=1 Tax=Botryotinia narcissicola TaxID=278944 RepID=A0A4Z1H4H2_9HELO|nr:hypothetical protein BOTNAR_1123g00020 [Botryotinia narcissicola]
MQRKNRAVRPKSEPQSNSPTEREPEALLRESQISTQSQSYFHEEDLGPEARLRESQISTQSYSDSDAVGADPKVGSPIALIEKVHDLLENQEEALATYISPQKLASSTRNDELETKGESASASNDQAAQNYGLRQEESLATKIQTSRLGAQIELDVEDDPLHMSSNEEPQNPFLDPPMHAAQTEAIHSEESDSDASLDLNKGGKPMWCARNDISRKTSRESDSDVSLDLNKEGEPSDLLKDKGSRKTSQGSVNRIANQSTKPPESALPSPAAKCYKVETTEMVRSETTRIIRGFQQENIRIETVLKPDPEIHTLRKKEEELEDHEMMLSTLVDELMSELKKTRGEFKKISRRNRRALADFEKASG